MLLFLLQGTHFENSCLRPMLLKLYTIITQGIFFKMQILNQWVWGGACYSAFLTSSLMMSTLLVLRPHLEWQESDLVALNPGCTL